MLFFQFGYRYTVQWDSTYLEVTGKAALGKSRLADVKMTVLTRRDPPGLAKGNGGGWVGPLS